MLGGAPRKDFFLLRILLSLSYNSWMLLYTILSRVCVLLETKEFMNISQVNMIIKKYEQYLIDISRYAPHILAIEEQKARYFARGLHPHICDKVDMLQLSTYIEVVNKAMIAKRIADDKAKRLGERVAQFLQERSRFYSTKQA